MRDLNVVILDATIETPTQSEGCLEFRAAYSSQGATLFHVFLVRCFTDSLQI
jgi:hypothetical protein